MRENKGIKIRKGKNEEMKRYEFYL